MSSKTKTTVKSHDLSDLGAMAEQTTSTMTGLRDTASSVHETVRGMVAARQQENEDRITFHFEKWLKNEGEQLNHPCSEDSQLFPRARYCLSFPAVVDAAMHFGPKTVLEAIAQAWWNSKVPAQWRPFFAVLVESAEDFYREEIVISNTIELG